MTTNDTAPLSDAVEIQPHGISGIDGAPHGVIARPQDPAGFSDAFWVSDPSRPTDLHAAFLGTVDVPAGGAGVWSLQASGNFRAYLDGELLVSGPLRFSPSLPEYHREGVVLAPGRHVLAIHAHGENLMTRTAAPVPNFVWSRLAVAGRTLPVSWRARELHEYRATGLRVSPLLGWVEWQQTPWSGDWKLEDSGRSPWHPVAHPVGLAAALGATSTPAEVSLRAWPRLSVEPFATGHYRDTFVGYDLDDLAVQFLLADPDVAADADPDGTWLRYDLGRVRIGALNITVQSTDDAEVTIAYAERLTPSGRPSPVVALSTGPTRMIQHFAVAAGTTRIEPLQSLGGRYVEVRVATRGEASVSDAQFVERDLLGDPRGSFDSDDALLNQIWTTGIHTLRSSAEDALVDSVRERGEWVGDVVSSALNILEAGWGDYRLIRRALLHSAAGARPDGLVAGCGPGEILYLGTYAAQWSTACVELAVAEGDISILRELEESGRANIAALAASIADDGSHTLPWGFVDWGYGVAKDQPDLAVLLHVLRAEQSWVRWMELLGNDDEASGWRSEVERMEALCRRWLDESANPYHSTTLAAIAGLVDAGEVSAPIIRHITSSFPVDRSARRLRSPVNVVAGSTTPYFTNYSVRVLLEAGLGTEVAAIWRSAWGWMLEQGATTWFEVFDERWSRCHYWSGAPTWQMSRYGLGLHPQLDREGAFASLRVNSLGLDRLAGAVHLSVPGVVRIEWTRSTDDTLDWVLELDGPLRLWSSSRFHHLEAGTHRFTLSRVAGTELYE